jgi:hypothetical protein
MKTLEISSRTMGAMAGGSQVIFSSTPV